jgi:hypothetical protein
MNGTIETGKFEVGDTVQFGKESDDMARHPIDTVSALCGLAVLTIAALVALGRTGALTSDSAWWIALAALVFGLALLPWGRVRRRHGSDDDRDDDMTLT